MASSLRVNAIIPSSGTNVAIGTAGGTVTYAASVSGICTFSSGIVVSAGSTSAPSISPTGDSNTGIFFPSADTVAFAEGGVEAARFDSNGRLGIGTQIPSAVINVRSSAAELARFTNTGSNGGDWEVKLGGGGFEDRKFMLTDKFGGTDNVRVSIDSSGRVSIPYQPAFRAVREGGGNPVITSPQRLPYDSTSASGGFDNTNSYNTSTFIYTAPVAGVYFFQASTYTELNTESMWDIRVNGNIRQRAELRQTAGDDIGDNSIINASCILSLSANDQVDVYWSSNSVQLITGSGLISFSGCKIS
jgi:hypothetical protein